MPTSSPFFFYLSFFLRDIGISYLVVYPLVSDSQNTVLTEKLYRQSLLAVETPDQLISSTGARGRLLTFFRPKTVISSRLRQNFKNGFSKVRYETFRISLSFLDGGHFLTNLLNKNEILLFPAARTGSVKWAQILTLLKLLPSIQPIFSMPKYYGWTICRSERNIGVYADITNIKVELKFIQ